MFISISPYIRYNWATLLRSWLVQNRVLFLLLAGWLIWTRPCRELLKSTSQRLTAHYEGRPYPGFLLGVILSLANTYAFYGPRRFNLPFWMWLAAMLLLHLRLVSAPMSWQIVQMGGSSIPWFAAAHLIFTVATCLVVTANTLEPGQSRIPLQHARVETRPLHDVVLVSSTAFGPPWLRQGLKTWFPRLPMLLNRRVPWLVSVAQGYNRIMNDYHIPIFFLIFVLSMSLLLTFWKLHDLLSFWSLGGFQTALALSNAIFRTSVDSHARLPSFEQLWLHQALRIDGRYYELTWMHFFADSTTLSDSAVEDDESYAQGEDDADGNGTSRRAILSERRIGQTYMTREEILRTGNELIKTSPGYDLFSYNCTWLRHNLFLRIKYDGSAEQKNPFLRRSSLASQLPYYGFLSLITRYIYALAPANDESSSFWQNPASGLFWFVFELMMLSMEARAVVVWSSTVLCRVYRSRMIMPMAIGILLLQHAYQHLNDGKLFSPYSTLAKIFGDNISAAMALICYTLVPIAIACMLATPLLVMCCDLNMTQERFEVVTDADDHNDGIPHRHRPHTEMGPTAAADPSHVTVRITSEYGERLSGETSKPGMMSFGEFFMYEGYKPESMRLNISFIFTTAYMLLILVVV